MPEPFANYGKCPNCGRYDFLNSHSCGRLFLVRQDQDDDFTEIYASDCDEAAERFVARDDYNYELAYHGRIVDVNVVADDETIVTIPVRCELVPDYHADPTLNRARQQEEDDDGT